MGSNTSLSNPAGLTFDQQDNLWVANSSAQTLASFAPGADGNANPQGIIAGADTRLDSPHQITLDGSSLVVANTYNNTIAEYPTGSYGDVSPAFTISGSVTGLDYPDGVDVDANNNVYVANEFGGVSEYPAGAWGNIPPVAELQGSNTGLSSPSALAVAPPLSVATQHLPAATVGHAYKQILRAYLGTTPYHWKVASGHLPAGLELKSDGELAGTPTTAGESTFTVTVTDSSHPVMKATRLLTLVVRPA
jgi:hypothetical protein